MPQILIEQDLHGPDIDANGAAFAGVSPYVLLGRGRDYAWSATSAGQDIIDTFAEELCEPDGSTPTVQSTHYLYKGTCRPMEILQRTNVITPNPADPSPPETYQLTAQRTVHGIVHKRGTVNGKPVAFARLRSTYFHEVDSARGFSDLNQPSKVAKVEDFQRAVAKIGFTFNWFYATTATSGTTTRATTPCGRPGSASPCPTGAPAPSTGGLQPDEPHGLLTPAAEHPQVINQPVLTQLEQQAGSGLRGG